jgi:aspartyl-tRNA(Asn)/glutamyl-tRNA(Gln) amidotransferase subunit C
MPEDQTVKPFSVDDAWRDTVVRISRLARIQIADDELDRYAGQMAEVLDLAGKMADLDLTGIEPTTHPYPLRNVMRDDVVGPLVDRDEVLAAAPSAEAGMFRVPPVIGLTE